MDLDAVARGHLKISSQLLSLARRILRGPEVAGSDMLAGFLDRTMSLRHRLLLLTLFISGTLIHEADVALYRAKELGRNRCVLARPTGLEESLTTRAKTPISTD